MFFKKTFGPSESNAPREYPEFPRSTLFLSEVAEEKRFKFTRYLQFEEGDFVENKKQFNKYGNNKWSFTRNEKKKNNNRIAYTKVSPKVNMN